METEKKHRGGHNYHPVKELVTYEYIYEGYVNKKRSLGDIAKDCKCTRQYIYKRIKQFNIPIRSKKEASELALDRGKISFKTIDSSGQEYTLIKQRIKINENFFSTWSNEMAYVLGVIYTDGNLIELTLKDERYKGIKSVKRLSISQKEPELLEKVLKLMDCNSRLIHRRRMEYNKIVSGETYIFLVHNEKICDDLIRIGLTPNKSKTIEFPQIPDKYVRHFIRGCWDGDGSVFNYSDISRVYRQNRIGATFVSGSLTFVQAMADKLADKLHEAGLIKRNIKKDKNSYRIAFAGEKNCKLLYKYLYENVTPDQYLERKYKIFENYFAGSEGHIFKCQ